MKIDRIRLKNYKAFKDVTLVDVPSFCVLVGANGVGKSTLFDVFGFLKDCLKDNVRSALAKRGSFKEVISRGAAPTDNIFLEIKVRMPLAGNERTVTYSIEIGNAQGVPVVEREILQYTRFGGGKPYRFLDFSRGAGSAITNEEEFREDADIKREDQRLESMDILAIKGLGQFQRFRAASAFRSLIENWQVSDFHIQAARNSMDAGYAEHLSSSGDNLALVVQFLQERHPATLKKILQVMSRRVPGIQGVDPVTAEGRTGLRYKDSSFAEPFLSRYVSDGTVKMLAYLVLLYDPTAHPLLCVEEPENQLYQSLLGELAEEFANYARRGGQVFVSTHSPDFLNSVPINSIYVLAKSKGFTTVSRGRDDINFVSLVDGGDLPGYLWRQGLFTGADPA
jgi:predicted ATPase